jgi:hypothetical protein
VRLQSAEATCGPCAVSNACKALGLVNVDEAEVVRWVNKVRKTSDPEVQGTNEEELLRAIVEGSPKKYKLHAEGLWVHNENLARSAFRGTVTDGAFPILAVDADSHWIVGLGVNGQRYMVADAANVEITIGYSWAELNGRWQVPGNPQAYYAIVLSRA